MEIKVNGASLEVVKGDIASQEDIEAVVNAANAQLKPGGGVAGALHRAAGPGLEEEGRKHAPIKPGEAVLTMGHDLPNDYVIHCLGPVYGVDEPSDELLASCYIEALRIAEENNISSVAFPAISTGAFGYPAKEAARVAFETVLNKMKELEKVSLARFVLFDRKSCDLHEEVLKEVSGK